ncbi:hypothetical protein RclHR1_00490002 [Rhizophagus clarus]|uniref:Uncharacterized protein n=1 Tax=Rhizophagus clarus TaxID=94130 RepID=A0A2Z6RJP9_9GLOM|nr:hypothetical protein RclHR1_00490002 [Rhizophagus clarus]
MKGNHNEDTKKGLQLISNWIMNLANSDNDLLKAKALSYFITVIEQLLSINENENEIYYPAPIILTSHELPSFFIISSLFKLYRINIKDYYYNFQDSQKIGSHIGLELIKNREKILQKKQELEEPNSLEEYRSAMPSILYELLDSIIQILYNINFKKKTFIYRNIYDTTRSSSHDTLRLLFQYQLPVKLNSIPDEEIQLNENTKLFGENLITNEVSLIFNTIFIQLLNCQTISNLSDQFSFEYDAKIINEKIINYFNHGPFCPPVHIIILEAGDNPNKDVNIKTACNQYFDDLQIDNDLGIEVWHTSKDMCSVLITIFSEYGIYNMAAILGMAFLDKLKKVIDYRSTCRVLDLIWVAIGSAIHIYILKNNLKLEAIMDSENNLLKI